MNQLRPPLPYTVRIVTFLVVFISSMYMKAQHHFSPMYMKAQNHGNCNNASFEFGNTDGYETYYGYIEGDGSVVIDLPGPTDDQHKIMTINDGIDPIAAMNCTLNDSLPVVPPGGGQYAIRLGNSANGAEAERILLNFLVTPDRTFFLLRYAVVLNDPGHDPHEQPRFEMRIRDEAGKIFDCGEYSVRAAGNIEGFENCGQWRVRPWTTVGFELQSYIGQNIEIEILTTDCSLGGHAGYAYIDASCQPIDLILDGYCPGSTAVEISATEGFDKYLWSTGETSSSITINNPSEGATYSVTVTSATGCTLELSDTLPPLVEPLAPLFDQVADTTICPGTGFWFRPTGENLRSIFSPDLGFAADSFFIAPFESRSYLFLTTDEFGCNTDEVWINVSLDSISTIIEIDQVFTNPPSCFGFSDGQISVQSNAVSYLWSMGSTASQIANLPADHYRVTLFDQHGCYNTLEYELIDPAPLSFDSVVVEHVPCHGDATGSISLLPTGGTGPYLDLNTNAEVHHILLDTLVASTYSIAIQDANGCFYGQTFAIQEPTALEVALAQDSVTCFGESDGRLNLLMSGGVAPYDRAWSDPNIQGDFANTLEAGLYQVTVVDANDCILIDSISVHEPPLLSIAGIHTDSMTCAYTEDGVAQIITQGGNGGNTYQWSHLAQPSTPLAVGLSEGNYAVTVTDYKGCSVVGQTDIYAPLPLQIDIKVDSVRCAGNANGAIQAIAMGGNGGYMFSWEGLPASTSTVSNLGAGTYAFELSDQNGCIEQLDITVFEPAPLEAVLTQDSVTCFGEADGQVHMWVSGGVRPYQYFWNDPSMQDTFSNTLQAGLYRVTIIDANDCILIDSISVHEPPLLSIMDMHMDSMTCSYTQDGTAQVFTQGGNGGNTYQWSDPYDQSTQQAFNLVEGEYFVTITDYKGCSVVGQTEILAPLPLQAEVMVDSVRCAGSADGLIQVNAMGGNGGYHYDWSDLSLSTSVISNLSPGIYTLEITDRKGCKEQIEIPVFEPADLFLEVLSETLPDCQNDVPATVAIGAFGGNGGFIYSWDNGEMGPIVSSFSSDDYVVTVTDIKGCSEELMVNTPGLQIAMISDADFVDNDVSICVEEDILLDLESNINLAHLTWWSNGYVSCVDCWPFIASPIESTLYQVVATDEVGCRDTAEIFVIVNQPYSELDFTGALENGVICLGEEIQVEVLADPPVRSLQWFSDQAISCDTCQVISLQPTTYTTISVDIQHLDGCPSSLEETIRVANDCGQFIPNAFSPNGDGINDRFNIPGSTFGTHIVLMEIFDRWGGLIFRGEDFDFGSDHGWDGTYNGSVLPTGPYVYKIIMAAINGEQKFYKGDVTLLR